jgi:hypothetical protein
VKADKAKAQPFVMLTRELSASHAWRALSINARRFVDFLMLEHMRQGGRRNGRLLAPQRQLIAYGIHANFVGAAIDEVERLGLVDCRRGIGRRPSEYGLTWLPLVDGPASNSWRHAATAATNIIEARKAAKTRVTSGRMPPKVQSQEMHALCADNTPQSAVTKPVKPPQSAVTTVPPQSACTLYKFLPRRCSLLYIGE